MQSGFGFYPQRSCAFVNANKSKDQEMSAVTLFAGNLELELSPSIGGSISGFVSKNGDQTFPILRKCHTPPEKALDACCFPLVPYVNRIRKGSFTFRGREVHLKPNMAGDPSPLHGQGWLNAWTVEDQKKASAKLSYRHEAGEWPWAYEAFQELALDETGLSARTLLPQHKSRRDALRARIPSLFPLRLGDADRYRCRLRLDRR